MWGRLPRDEKHKTRPARRCTFLLEGIGLCLEFLGAATRQTEMWRRLPRDEKHKTRPARRCTFLLDGIGLCLEFLGAATRQACDLEGVGAGARQLSNLRNLYILIINKKRPPGFHLMDVFILAFKRLQVFI